MRQPPSLDDWLNLILTHQWSGNDCWWRWTSFDKAGWRICPSYRSDPACHEGNSLQASQTAHWTRTSSARKLLHRFAWTSGGSHLCCLKKDILDISSSESITYKHPNLPRLCNKRFEKFCKNQRESLIRFTFRKSFLIAIFPWFSQQKSRNNLEKMNFNNSPKPVR